MRKIIALIKSCLLVSLITSVTAHAIVEGDAFRDDRLTPSKKFSQMKRPELVDFLKTGDSSAVLVINKVDNRKGIVIVSGRIGSSYFSNVKLKVSNRSLHPDIVTLDGRQDVKSDNRIVKIYFTLRLKEKRGSLGSSDYLAGKPIQFLFLVDDYSGGMTTTSGSEYPIGSMLTFDKVGNNKRLARAKPVIQIADENIPVAIETSSTGEAAPANGQRAIFGMDDVDALGNSSDSSELAGPDSITAVRTRAVSAGGPDDVSGLSCIGALL